MKANTALLARIAMSVSSLFGSLALVSQLPADSAYRTAALYDPTLWGLATLATLLVAGAVAVRRLRPAS